MKQSLAKTVCVRLCSMKMLKALVSMIAVFALLLCGGCKTQSSVSAGNTIDTICADDVYVDQENSWFSDFHIEADKVYITCHIELCNKSHARTVRLYGVFSDDVGTLVTESVLPGFITDDFDSNDNSFLLAPGAQTYDVTFIGTFAGTEQKNDRLLPQILIEEAS